MKNVFESMPDQIQKVLKSAGFKEPTAIQSEAIPHIVAGKDVLGIAQTGTGKTAAFVLPMLQRMILDPRTGIRTLILCPTRELAMQVSEHIKLFTRHTKIRHVAVYGGVNQNPQVQELKKGVDILVATPGRLFDLHEQGFVKLGKIEFFVLDEADRMLDMGFIHDIRRISQLIPKTRQTLFFSATMSGEISRLANSILHDPVRVEVTPQATPVEKIQQHVLFVDPKQKVELLLHLLEQKQLDKVLIFTKTKHGADKLCRKLKANKISAHQIHGDRTQNQRTQALKAFTTGKVRCLVATDVAARGIDINDITHVINYDLPMEAENYVHRIGRTARAGAEGTAYSFCMGDDIMLLKAIHRAIGMELPIMEHKFHSEKAKTSRGSASATRRGPPPNRRGSRGAPRNFARKRPSRGPKKFIDRKPARSQRGKGPSESRSSPRPFTKKPSAPRDSSSRDKRDALRTGKRPVRSSGPSKRSGARKRTPKGGSSRTFKKRHGRTPSGGRL